MTCYRIIGKMRLYSKYYFAVRDNKDTGHPGTSAAGTSANGSHHEKSESTERLSGISVPEATTGLLIESARDK
jgi:hypothetical protein